jgi:uncharacterized protein
MNSLIKKNKPALEKLCQSLSVKQLFIFGSGTDNSLKKESDLDFLVTFKEGLSVEKYTDNYFELHQKLEKLFNRDIDLITERSLSNPYFIDSVNKSKKLIYDEEHQKIPF